MESEWKFRSSRRGLLKFLSGATLISGPALVSKSLKEPEEGSVVLAHPEDIPKLAKSLPGKPLTKSPIEPLLARTRTTEMDVTPWRWYDSLELDPNSSTVQKFFNHSAYRDAPVGFTNMYMPNALPCPETFSLNRLWVLLHGGRQAAEAFALMSNVSLWIMNKRYMDVSLLDISRFGLDQTGFSDEPGPRCMEFQTIPPIIGPQEFFYVEIDSEQPPASRLFVKIVMDGLLARSLR